MNRACVGVRAGLKPGQRKVLFTCLKRNDKREVKVAQLAGSVAEMSAYHHGEVLSPSTRSPPQSWLAWERTAPRVGVDCGEASKFSTDLMISPLVHVVVVQSASPDDDHRELGAELRGQQQRQHPAASGPVWEIGRASCRERV